jgi:hypothetical protein
MKKVFALDYFNWRLFAMPYDKDLEQDIYGIRAAEGRPMAKCIFSRS